jgi:hypothetical protein
MDNNTPITLSKMSLDEARSVIWPFQELKGQSIGSLLDSGLLSLKDLGFAAQRAWDWRVREAARTLLLHALSQEPLESEMASGPLNVISSERRSFAERRQLEITMFLGMVVGLMLLPVPYLLWLGYHQITASSSDKPVSEAASSVSGLIALVIGILIGFGLMIAMVYVIGKLIDRLLFDRLIKELQLHRKGQLGEERVLNVMYGVLGADWWLFRNLELPGRHLGDLDSVLVGPHGVWSFEVKAYSGEYRNVGERWERRNGAKWFSLHKNPTRQARRNAAELSQFLATNQIKQWVTPVIVWANPESTVVLDSPSTFVWPLDQVSDHLMDLSSERPLSDAQVQRIVGVLKKTYQDEGDS